MKSKNLLMAFAIASFAISFTSCKKENAAAVDEFETTFDVSGDQAITDNLTEDANDVLNETAVQNNFSGNSPVEATQTLNILSCATVTVTPLQGFPKNIVIDFGAGCTSSNGVFRKGKIKIAISDSLRRSGSIAVMTFDGYYVNSFKIEGTATWTNTSTPGTKSWQRKWEDGKVTAPDGKYWLHNGVRNVTQTAGVSTPNNLLDDVFSITGNHSVTNANGKTRTSSVLDALQKKVICDNIDKGRIKIDGPNHYAILDFGDGTCDRVATISIDGRPPRTILLR